MKKSSAKIEHQVESIVDEFPELAGVAKAIRDGEGKEAYKNIKAACEARRVKAHATQTAADKRRIEGEGLRGAKRRAGVERLLNIDVQHRYFRA